MGKTTVSNHLAIVHHLPVLDADLLAREAVEPGSRVLQELVERYGSCILRPDQTLDRLRLGEIVFSNSAERLWLEQRIHPYVRERLELGLKTIAAQHHAIAVLVVPLLFEARMVDLVTEIWVVTCPQEQQIDRLQHRDQLSLDQIQARINSQMAIDKKMQRADVVLENASTLEDLLTQVDAALLQVQPAPLDCPSSPASSES